MESFHTFFHSLCLGRFLFLIIISISILASYCDGACKVFTCGNFTMDYPFGLKNSGCGDPTLQFECNHTVKGVLPLLDIGGQQYYILGLKHYSKVNSWEGYYNHTMRILHKNLMEDQCDLSGNFYDQFFDGPHFHIADGYRFLTLGKTCFKGYSEHLVDNITCNDHGYYNLSVPDTSINCESKFDLPVNENDLRKPLDEIVVQGLEIRWTASKYCEGCESGHKNCAYRKTPSFCYCGGISYSQKCRNNGKYGTTIIVGPSLAIGLFFMVVLLLVVMYRKRQSFYKKFQLPLAIEPAMPKVEKFLQDFTRQMPTRYSYSELKKITNNFADKLGEGGFGVVFKGKLRRGNLVAVKILDQSRHSENQFINEVATIGGIHHVHLVRLMGYCFEGFRSALVYEYMVNSSLDKFIFAGRGEERDLSWEQLCSTALGAARGIAYLHEDCHSRIIHFDIKPHNILLDHEFTPKIADFGLAKLCGRGEDHMSMTAARGTPGYIAPEVWSRNLGPVTDRCDVYSFGMLLLEMVGGRKNIELVSRSSQVYFPEWAFKLLENGQIQRILRGKGNTEIGFADEEKARKMTKVGLWCIQYDSSDRPSMKCVVQMLEGNGDNVGNPPPPFNSSAARQRTLISSSQDNSSTV